MYAPTHSSCLAWKHLGDSDDADIPLNAVLDEVLDEMESLYESNKYTGDAAELFALLEEYPGAWDRQMH